MQRNEDLLLGMLALRERCCTQEQIDECFRVQANGREAAPLGDILLYKGYLTEAQLKELLTRLQKKLMACAACGLSFKVLTLSGGKFARCPKCKGPLKEASETLLQPDAEFSTRLVPVQPAPAGPDIHLVCVICDHAFRGNLGSDGRVRCPSCHSTYRPGGSA